MKRLVINAVAVVAITFGAIGLMRGEAVAVEGCCYNDCMNHCRAEGHLFLECHNFCNQQCDACPPPIQPEG